jgi:hypothetical protein
MFINLQCGNPTLLHWLQHGFFTWLDACCCKSHTLVIGLHRATRVKTKCPYQEDGMHHYEGQETTKSVVLIVNLLNVQMSSNIYGFSIRLEDFQLGQPVDPCRNFNKKAGWIPHTAQLAEDLFA